MKIASFGAVFVIGNGVLMHYLTIKRFKQSPYFLLAQEAVLANRALVELLGEPLEFGSADLENRERNFSTTSEAKFEISLKGSKTSGVLYFNATRKANIEDEPSEKSSALEPSGGNYNTDSAGWLLRSLEVTVKDKPNQKLILLKRSD